MWEPSIDFNRETLLGAAAKNKARKIRTKIIAGKIQRLEQDHKSNLNLKKH